MQQGAELRHHAEDAQELSVLPLPALREGGHEAQLGPRRQRLQDRQGEIGWIGIPEDVTVMDLYKVSVSRLTKLSKRRRGPANQLRRQASPDPTIWPTNYLGRARQVVFPFEAINHDS